MKQQEENFQLIDQQTTIINDRGFNSNSLSEYTAIFVSSTKRLVNQLFQKLQINYKVEQYENSISCEQIQYQALNIIQNAYEYWKMQIDSWHRIVGIITASVYISLNISGLNFNMSLLQLKQKSSMQLSDLQTLQLYVDVVEVFWNESAQEQHSIDKIQNNEIESSCIENVFDFLVLCDELIRQTLLKERAENKYKYIECLQKIINIERNYSESCTNAAKMHMLQIVDIWGREWRPEQVLQIDYEKVPNNINRKRRRIEDDDDEYQDHHNQDDLQNKSLKKIKSNSSQQESIQQIRENIMNIIKSQLQQYEDSIFQEENANPSQSTNEMKIDQDQQQEIDSCDEIFGEEETKKHIINQLQSSCSSHFQKSSNINQRNISGLYRSIPPIITDEPYIASTSPLSHPFAQANMKIPFFIVCRQEELWETISKILSQLTSNTNDSKMNQLQIKLRKDNSNHAMRKFDETVRSLIDSQLFGKKAMKINRIQRFSQNQPKDDTYQINDVLSWCFKVSGSIDMTTALAQEEERRSVTEQWIMPNFQSAQFNDIIQIVLDELNKISPSKATQAKKIFKQESCKTGTGMVPLYLTRDLIAYAHNITGQHILNINKKIFIENDALFSQIGPSWCLNQMNSHKRKSNRRALKSSNSSVDQQIEQVDNDEQFQLKKKRKRDEDN